jgi:hypothetical protein
MPNVTAFTCVENREVACGASTRSQVARFAGFVRRKNRMPNAIALASEPAGFATSPAPKARPHFLTSGGSRTLTLAPSGAAAT